ncbi:hypothetical protein [Streptomyces syringium]|uniref:hypothetical protein n=1 Tax=Streptomyces syringium TaxID=76729 RepID=UPI0034561701
MTDERMPWYVWTVLLGALAMSAPGEYDLAVAAGWFWAVAWVMPVVVSVYGAVAAYVARKVPKGTPARRSAVIGALAALTLALAFQVTAHLMAAGYVHESGWLVAAVSATPPVVVAHLMHMPHPGAKAAGRPVTAKAKEAGGVAAVAANGRSAEVATASEPPEAVAVGPVAATVAADDPEAEPVPVAVAVAPTGDHMAKVVTRAEAVADVPTRPAATGTASADVHEPETLPGLALVATDGQPAGTAKGGRGRRQTRGRGVPDAATVRAAMADLEARGVPVTGETLGQHFGVAGRTGRRYMAAAA